jgi:hypothetical protein
MIAGTRRNVGAVLAAGLAIAGAVALTSTSASGEDFPFPEATDPVYVPFGTLTIELGDRTGQLQFDPAGGGSNVTQPLLNAQPCNQVTLGDISAGTGDLLALVPLVNGVTGPGDSVQQPGEFLGIQTAGENCGRQAEVIGPAELLEISLGSYFDSTVFVRSFSAAVDKKFNNDGSLTVGFDGGDQDLQKPVATGGSLVSIADTDIPGGMFTSATFGSTSNRDNRGLSIGDATLELVTLSDDFEVAVDCGEKVTEDGPPITAVFVRGANDPAAQAAKKNPGPCSDVGVIVQNEIDDDFEPRLFWDNGAISVVDGTDQAVAAKITIFWQPADVSAAGVPTLIDYDAAGTTFGYEDSQYCLSFEEQTVPADDPADDPIPLYIVDFPPTLGDDPDDVPWCTVSRTDQITPDGKVLITEVKVGQGDPWGKVR